MAIADGSEDPASPPDSFIGIVSSTPLSDALRGLMAVSLRGVEDAPPCQLGDRDLDVIPARKGGSGRGSRDGFAARVAQLEERAGL